MNKFDEIKNKIVGVIVAVFPTAKVYLFGSRARHTHNDRSDIDIAIDVGQKVDRIKVGEIRDMLNASHIPYKIDIVDIHNVNEAMKTSILRDGILWKE